MFTYDSADITYAVTFGKLDGSSDIDYSVDLNQKEAKIYTKARMLGQDLDEVMDTDRIEREIVRYERSEYGSDIRDAKVSIWFCGNQEQPPIEDIKAYLSDLLKARKYDLAYEVIEAQATVFEDTDNDWKQIAFDLAKEIGRSGFVKKYDDIVLRKQNAGLKGISEKLRDAHDNFGIYAGKLLAALKNYDDVSRWHCYYSDGFYYIVTKVIDGQERMGVLGHTGELLLPCKYTFLHEVLDYKCSIGKNKYSVYDYLAYQEEKDGLFGIIKIDGTVIIEPSFRYIEYTKFRHNFNHKLIVAGDDEDHQGVYSLELNKFIVPCKYDWVEINLVGIDCLHHYNHNLFDRVDFDYGGNLIKKELVEFKKVGKNYEYVIRD